MWAGVTAWIWVALLTVTDDAATPPNRTVSPAWKFEPEIVTGVPPEVGPDLGDMLLTIGAEAGAMLALKLLEAVWPAESLA
jgi:hypothetical protein